MSHNTTRQQVLSYIEDVRVRAAQAGWPTPEKWQEDLGEVQRFLDAGGELIHKENLRGAYNATLDSNCYLFARGIQIKDPQNMNPSNFNLQKIEDNGDIGHRSLDFSDNKEGLLVRALAADNVLPFGKLAMADIQQRYPILAFKTSANDYHFIVPCAGDGADQTPVVFWHKPSANKMDKPEKYCSLAKLLDNYNKWGVGHIEWGTAHNYELLGVFYANKNDAGTRIMPNLQGKLEVTKPCLKR